LPETNSRTGVEWEEDEWVGGEVLVQPLVEEPIWVEFERWAAQECQFNFW